MNSEHVVPYPATSQFSAISTIILGCVGYNKESYSAMPDCT